jgi:Holliday junction resolvase-like predicted endonuclease
MFTNKSFYGFQITKNGTINGLTYNKATCRKSMQFLTKTDSEELIGFLEHHGLGYRTYEAHCVECLNERIINRGVESFYAKGLFDESKFLLFKERLKETFPFSPIHCNLHGNSKIKVFVPCCSEHKAPLESLKAEIDKIAFEVLNKSIQIDISSMSELDLEDALVHNIHLIEKGMTLVQRQYAVDGGRLDLLTRDKDGILCIIELKVKGDDERLVFQSMYYPTQFNEPVRMITIAPYYAPKISTSLDSLPNKVEKKIYVTTSKGRIIIKDFNN